MLPVQGPHSENHCFRTYRETEKVKNHQIGNLQSSLLDFLRHSCLTKKKELNLDLSRYVKEQAESRQKSVLKMISK